MSRGPRKNRLPDHHDPDRSRRTAPGTTYGRVASKEPPRPEPHRRPNDAFRAAAVSVFLLLAVVLVFGQTVGHEFVNYDDNPYVYENAVVQRGLTLEGLRWALTYGELGHWHPLTWISHMLDCRIHGLRAGGHHLTNLLLHGCAAILLFLALWRMTGCLWRAAFVAAVFAVHPLRAESVAWVAERKDVLSALFFMLTLLAYHRYVRSPSSGTRRGAVILLFALGLLSKNMLVTLPFVLLLLDYWPLKRMPDFTFPTLSRLAAEKWPLFVLSAASCVITLLVPEEVPVSERLPMALRLENAVVSYAVYLRQMIWPAGLACLYPHASGHLPLLHVAAAAAVLSALSWAAFAFRRNHPYLPVGWLWYLGMMVPVIGIVQISYYAHADRYTYLPQIGLYIVLAWSAADLSAGWRRRGIVLPSLAAIILAALIFTAHAQVAHWRNSESLWRRALQCAPQNYFAHMNLGSALKQQGRLGEAADHFRKVVEIKPDHAEAYNNLGIVLGEARQVDDAIRHFQKALGINPGYVEARNNLGMALARHGRIQEAMVQFRMALDIRPDYAEARNNLGNALMGRGEVGEAIVHFRKALGIKPGYAKAHNNLGIALASRGEIDEAIVHFRMALEIQPDYALARSNLYKALQQSGRRSGAGVGSPPP